MRTKLHAFILMFILLFAWDVSSFAALPSAFRPGRFRFSAETEYFSTKANYDKDGEKVDLPTNESYSVLTNSFDAAMYTDSRMAWSAGVGYAYAKSTDSFSVDRTNGVFTDAHASVQKLIALSAFRLIPEIQVLFPFKEIDPNGDEVLTNEGVTTIKAGSWAAFPLGPVKLYGYAGYENRGDGRSALLPWLVGLDWKATSAWSLDAEIGGFRSISDDEFKANDQTIRRTSVTNKVDGGSLRYYSVNPNLTDVKIEARFAASRDFTIQAGLAQTLAGQNTAQGMTILVGVALNMDPPAIIDQEARRRAAPTRHAESKSRKRGEKEKGLDDGYDEPKDQFTPTIEEEYNDRDFNPDPND